MTRLILKMSGEAIGDTTSEAPIDDQRLRAFVNGVAGALSTNPDIELGIVVGGGNIVRGRDLPGTPAQYADQMGMLGTVINGLALRAGLEAVGLECRLMSSIEMRSVAEQEARSRPGGWPGFAVFHHGYCCYTQGSRRRC